MAFIGRECSPIPRIKTISKGVRLAFLDTTARQSRGNLPQTARRTIAVRTNKTDSEGEISSAHRLLREGNESTGSLGINWRRP
jgi:hypothetical protein